MSLPVCVFTVDNSNYENRVGIIVDLINHTIVTVSNSIGFATGKFDRSHGPGR